MKKLSPYMLVRRASADAEDPSPPLLQAAAPDRRKARRKPPAVAATAERVVDRLLGAADLKKTFAALDPAFRQTLLDVYRDAPPAPPKKAKQKRAEKRAPSSAPPPKTNYVEQITRDLGRAAQVRRVGLLDLGAWIADLPELLVRLNAAQDLYTLFEINAPVPSGLRKTADGMVAWMREHGVKATSAQRRDMQPHLVADDYFAVAEGIRSAMGLDLVVGLAAALIAGQSNDALYWNHFSAVYGQTAVVSTTDLREYAEQAGRPFEAAVGVLLVGAVLVAFNDRLDYHADRGCVFDYNEARTTLVTAIKSPTLCEVCRAKLSSEQQAAADAMLAVLRRMKRKST